MLFLILIFLLQIITIKGSYFDVLVNSDASPSGYQYSLIIKERVLSVMRCLSACSLNEDCLTAVYSKIYSNCFLFKDQLSSSNIVASTSSNLYLKKSSKLAFHESTSNKLISFHLKVVHFLPSFRIHHFKLPLNHFLESVSPP